MTLVYRQPFRNEWPITQEYGEKITSSFHTGIDYGCPEGTEILASADGKVVYIGYEKLGYGNFLILQNESGVATLYAHLKDVYVSKKKIVKQGELIGHSGNTGNSTGPHLHFEARKQWNNPSSHFDPMKLPLVSVDDSISKQGNISQHSSGLKEASSFTAGDILHIACPEGAWVHSSDFTSKKVSIMFTEFEYTGNTIERNGLTYCECRVPGLFWIAVHNNVVQILDK